MKTIVVYASRKGNTQRVAQEVANAVLGGGPVEMLEAGDAPDALPNADLLFFGAPTEGHGVMPAMAAYLDRMDAVSVAGKAVAVFDTRIDWPRILSGSAADGLAKRLSAIGANVVVAPESFIVNRTPELLPGELERVGTWAADVARVVEARSPVGAAR